MRRKIRTPAAPAFRNAAALVLTLRIRPTGRPRKMVKPATAPSR
jgi:hypothetical protein